MIVKRLKQFIVKSGISIEELGKSIGISEEILEKSFSEEKEISLEWIVLINEKYPEINIKWLALGEGDMYTANKKQIKDLKSISSEDILDYILANSDAFRDEPKLDAVVALFSNFEQQRELQKMYEKIDKYEKLLGKK